LGVPLAFDLFQAGDLLLLYRGVDLQRLDRLLVRLLEGVDADDEFAPRIDLALVGEGGLGDFAPEKALLDAGDHAADLLDALEVVTGLLLHLPRQRLDKVA